MSDDPTTLHKPWPSSGGDPLPMNEEERAADQRFEDWGRRNGFRAQVAFRPALRTWILQLDRGSHCMTTEHESLPIAVDRCIMAMSMLCGGMQ